MSGLREPLRPRAEAAASSADAYRDAVAGALGEGWRFVALHVAPGGDSVRTLLRGPDGARRIESAAVVDGAAPSLVDLAPAAGWDEREAHDLHGIGFTGHAPLRPLIEHDLRVERWTVPVRGEDPYQVAVGPIHAGVIESGHFRFHVVGDRILFVDVRLAYKHRGLERAAEGRTLEEALPFVARACGACAVSSSVAYVQACEEALGLRPTPQLARVRTVLLELERTWSHLNDVAAICAGVGLAPGNTAFAALTERARRLNSELTGHRLLFGSVRLGGSALAVDGHRARAAREEVAAIGTAARRAWRELCFNASFQDRLPGVGLVDAGTADELGAVGPAARASGLAEDARATSPGLAYGEFRPVLPATASGDVQARLEQRALELWQSLALLERLLSLPVRPAVADGGGRERPVGAAIVESPRGATTCVVERAGDRVERVRLRTGSYANWPVVARAAQENLLADFPLINKSFELCYACADR